MKGESIELGSLETVVTDGVKVLSTVEQMTDFKTLWSNLDQRTKADFVWFQSYEWCSNWMQTHGKGLLPFVLMLIENGKAIAVLPLMKKHNKFGLCILEILGAPHTQYSNILTENGTLDHASAKALQNAIMAEQGIDQVLFHLVPHMSPLCALANDAIGLPYLANSASLLDLKQFPTADAFEKSIGKKTSRNLRRSINHFEKSGQLRLEVVRPGATNFASLIEKCLQMKADWLTQTGRVSLGLACDDHDHFLSSLAKLSDNGDGPIVFALVTGETTIAIELGFLQRGHYYAYLGAFDWSLRNYSPGKLQMHLSIQWLIENGVRTLDLLGNPADYKQHYASIDAPLVGFAIATTVRGKLYTRLWTGLGRPKVKQLFLSIPKNWRTSLIVLRKLEYNFIG